MAVWGRKWEQRAAACSCLAMSERDLLVLALTVEIGELHTQLAEAQDQCVELAVDAGELHGEIEALRGQLADLERERDAWQAQGEHLGHRYRQTG